MHAILALESCRRVELAKQAQAKAMVRWHFLQTKEVTITIGDGISGIRSETDDLYMLFGYDLLL
ncbi:hypothetical protein OA79_12595 [Marinomonas sp. TW1]|nr:hypothetical protein OA79_12595 [Marinomonas sp. TW1]